MAALNLPVDSRGPDTGPLNPFEASFALFRALRDEIMNLKAEVEELRNNHSARVEKVENDLETARSTLTKRCDQLDTAHQDEKVSRNMRFDRMGNVVEELRKVKRARLDTLDQQMKAEMNLRFEQNQQLDQKMRTEAQQVRTLLEKHEVEWSEHKQKAESDQASDRARYDELRQDLEKLAALLSDSSLTRDPFNQLGYRHMQPGGPHTPLGATAHGNSLPPLMATSARVTPLSKTRGTFDQTLSPHAFPNPK
jgi:DNA repair exonuclease SbcCD ATPase subunit